MIETGIHYLSRYASPLGEIVMAADVGDALTGLWLPGQLHFASTLAHEVREEERDVHRLAAEWLDCYFAGEVPRFMPRVDLQGTPFQLKVWSVLLGIPYGMTMSYGEVAREVARMMGVERMSAQAVGGAVGRNPISIIIPCHRVVGSRGNMTGYAGGIAKKVALLQLEGVLRTACPPC